MPNSDLWGNSRSFPLFGHFFTVGTPLVRSFCVSVTCVVDGIAHYSLSRGPLSIGKFLVTDLLDRWSSRVSGLIIYANPNVLPHFARSGVYSLPVKTGGAQRVWASEFPRFLEE